MMESVPLYFEHETSDGTYVGGIKRRDPMFISEAQRKKYARDIIRADETTYANLICLIASCSGSTQLCHSGLPYDMHPRMIRDTFKPEFPRRTAEIMYQQTFSYSEHRTKLTILHCCS